MTDSEKSASGLNTVVQYRPGEVFGRTLAELAERWNVERNAVARELAILATFEMSAQHRVLIHELSVVMAGHATRGSNDFLRACAHVAGAVQIKIRELAADGLQTPNDQIRLELIKKVVSEYLDLRSLANRWSQPRSPETEEPVLPPDPRRSPNRP